MSSPESRPWPVAADAQAGPDLVENFVVEQHDAAAEVKIARKGPNSIKVGLSDQDRADARRLAAAYVDLKAEAAAEPANAALQAACAQSHEDLVFLLNLVSGSKHMAERAAEQFIEQAAGK
jgi:hypothetical protein